MSYLVREHQSQKTQKCYYYNNTNLKNTPLHCMPTHTPHRPNVYNTHYLRRARVDNGIFNVFHYYCKNFSINFHFTTTN